MNYITATDLTLNYAPRKDKRPLIKAGYKPETSPHGTPDTFSTGEYAIYIKKTDNILVIDIDNKFGQADKSLASMLAVFPIFQKALIERTSGGGYHIWTRAPFSTRDTDRGGMGIDFIGAGWIFCANLTDEKWQVGKYVIHQHGEMVELDNATYQRLLYLYPSKSATQTSGDIIPIKKNAKYYLAKDLIQDKERGDAMFQIFSDWIRHGKTKEECIALYGELKIESKEEFEETFNPHSYYATIKTREETSQEDRMAYALKEYIYVRSTDEIFITSERISKSYEAVRKYRPEMTTIITGDKIKHTSLIEAWLHHPDRIAVDDTGFRPSDDITFSYASRTYVNTYIDYRPEPWGEAVSREDPDILPYFQILDRLCCEDKQTIDVIEELYARKINKPAFKIRWCPYMISQQEGLGKQLLWDINKRLVGGYSVRVKGKSLASDFNSEYFTALTVLVDEVNSVAMFNQGVSGNEALKTLIGDMSDNEHGKGSNRGIFEKPLYYLVELQGNEPRGVRVTINSRRFYVIYNKLDPLADEVYDKAGLIVTPQWDNAEEVEYSERALRKLRRYFADYKNKMEPFPQRAPASRWKQEVAELSQDNLTQLLIQALADDKEYFDSDIITTQIIQEYFKLEHKKANLSPQKIGKMMLDIEDLGKCKRLTKTKASNRWPKMLMQGKLGKHKAGLTPIVYAINDFKKYENMSLNELRDNYYPFIIEV